MSGQGSFVDDAEQRARWEGFQWTDENARKAREIIARYPEGRQLEVSPVCTCTEHQTRT